MPSSLAFSLDYGGSDGGHVCLHLTQALVPATALVFAMAGLSGYCFSLIARVCEMNKCNTYMEAWERSIG